ncbi:MAG: hypothetical protein R3F29_12370 [Planctomycetota bacterium]
MSSTAGRGARWLTGIAVASLVAAGWLMVTPGANERVDSDAADSFSASAIGHLGLVELLRSTGEAVVQQRSSRPRDLRGVLVFAEPKPLADELEAAELERLGECYERATQVLVVAPKRKAVADPQRRGWLEDAPLLPIRDVEAVLEHYWAGGSAVLRVDPPRSWRTTDGLPWPDLPGPVQLLDDDGTLQPLISCQDGVLLGLYDGVAVLSDPDLIANHGLLRGDNAALAVALLRLLSGGGGIVFDETRHGHGQEPSMLHAAGRYPLALVSVHLLLLAAVVAFAARGRFGPPLAAPSPIGAGKAFLIENVASLLATTGNHGRSLRRYVNLRVREAAAAHHAPSGLDDERCLAFLGERLSAADAAELQAIVSAAHHAYAARDTAALAARIHALTERSKHAG